VLRIAAKIAKLPELLFGCCDLFPGIHCWGNGLDQTLPKTEIEQLDIRIHAEL
jgi:hypothetical protein